MRDSTDPRSPKADGFDASDGLLGPLPAAPDCAFGPLAAGGGPSLTPLGPVAGCSPDNAPRSEEGLPSIPPDVPGTADAGGAGPPPGFTAAPVTGVSTLPRMIGRPSLPEPIMTIFAFDDCASARVALMPCQRR